MAKTLNLLFAQPPAGVSDQEFNEWYNAHIEEIVTIPGWVAAQRFRLEASEDGTVPFGYLTVYELTGTFEEGMKAMEDASLSNYEQYLEYKKTHPDPPIPEWFTQIKFEWWPGVAVSERVIQTPAG